MNLTEIPILVKIAIALMFLLIIAILTLASCSAYSAVENESALRSENRVSSITVVPEATSMKLLPPQSGIYHAAFPDFGPTEDVVSARRINAFVNQISEKEIVWAYFSDNWFDGIRFPSREVAVIRREGVIPFIRMMPRGNWDEGCADRTYSLERILSGQFDDALRDYARAAKNSGGPLIAEFGTEMNGDWFPWSGVCNGGGRRNGYGSPDLADGPERFRDAYTRIIDIFRSEGANNVTWFIHYNGITAPNAAWNRLGDYYPGDDYIDWLGLSAYGAQSPTELRRWNPDFRSVMDIGYANVAQVSSSKPIALLEVGVTLQGGKPDWVRAAMSDLLSGRYPRVKAVSWWHSNWRNRDGSLSTMRLDSSEEARLAYREAVSSPIFTPIPRLSN